MAEAKAGLASEKYSAERRTGLLVTVDEMHVSEIDEIREFGNVFQLVSAMLPDAASSAVSDVGGRWGHNPSSLSTYRRRLLAVGLIASVGRGRVTFADSTVRGYVEARAAAEGFTEYSDEVL